MGEGDAGLLQDAKGEMPAATCDDKRVEDSQAEARARLGLLIAELRRARKRLRLTQEELAAGLDVSPLAIGSWETGKDKPTTANFLRWAESLGYVAAIGDLPVWVRLTRATPLRGEPLEAFRTRCLLTTLGDVRRSTGRTQEMVGALVGVSAWTVHMWETDHRVPRLVRLVEWCTVLGCRLTLTEV